MLAAAAPIFVLLYLLGVRRKASWIASLGGWSAAAAVAIFIYWMPIGKAPSAAAYGAAFGLFPIGWVVFTTILLFRLTETSGQFEILKDSVGGLSRDRTPAR